MRFSKAPLIATLMAVALSLLVILPALAVNTDGKGYQGRGTDDELIVGVFADAADSRGAGKATGLTFSAKKAERTRAYMIDTSAAKAKTNAADPENTFFNGKLYVSNQDDAFNTVLVTHLVSGATLPCTSVTVENESTGSKITLSLVPTGTEIADPAAVYYQNYFEIVDRDAEIPVDDSIGPYNNCEGIVATTGDPVPTTAKAIARINASDGDMLRITAGTWVQELHVDGTPPEFSGVTPEDKAIQTSTTLRIGFTVRDDGSGLRHDGEDRTAKADDFDPERSNLDEDQVYEGEPLSTVDGASQDIDVEIAGKGDQSSHGSGGWEVTEPGVEYRLSLNYNTGTSGDFEWQLTAKDRVGNETDEKEYTLTIDDDQPVIVLADTGIAYDDKKDVEIKVRSSIVLEFDNDHSGAPDKLDPDRLDHTRFLLDRAVGAEPIEVVGVVHSTGDKEGKGKDLAGDSIDVQAARVYLELSRDLGSDEKPLIQMLSGAVTDLAGNINDPALQKTRDRIEPGFTVTITADVMGRPAIGDDGEFEVTITSDEKLAGSPDIFVASIGVDGTVTIADVQSSKVTSAGGNSWSQTLDDSDLPGGKNDGLYAVIVTGEDAADNPGSTAGWSGDGDAPVADNELDLVKLDAAALLIERDTALLEAKAEFTPRLSDATPIVTESRNPFVKLDFADEGKENKIDGKASVKVTKTAVKTDGTTVKFDSHGAVTLGAVTLNGDAVDASQLRTLGASEFLVQLNGLDLAKYELKYTATDELGNSATNTVKFEVKARPPYKVTLRPGWNLVSLPGTPADPAIGSVIGDDLSVKLVLGYQDGGWLTAIRDSEGWSGTLTEISGGWGYWVQSTAFETISAVIPDADTSSTLPTVPVTHGWNLLGVVDIQQAKAGMEPVGKGEADDYFTSIPWRVAYSYNTRTTSWTKLAPNIGDASDEILNAKGYWVWSSGVGTLVP